ncbi:hypothetical protein [Falsibacillus pallidus]|uniref:Lipoprotein n=1 Tax=Falsibacillus pallidus TaxID=493781 RepID=A0A370H1D4_9BACI|nr:hypothetical protein [Falsibacillus pallidus]RDI47853.1 hypothetical protein DFR59_101518 [Falsibacillus pallidus]
MKVWKLGIFSLILILGGCKEHETVQPAPSTSKSPHVTTEEALKDMSEEIYQCLRNEDFDCLSEYIPDNGSVLFSPYAAIGENPVRLKKENLPSLMDDSSLYTWGIGDGSGIPIELTAKNFVHKFLLNNPYPDPDEVIFDKLEDRGNAMMNIKDYFPGGHTIEYYFKGTDSNGFMDWTSLYFVYVKDDGGKWRLAALIHNQWTI